MTDIEHVYELKLHGMLMWNKVSSSLEIQKFFLTLSLQICFFLKNNSDAYKLMLTYQGKGIPILFPTILGKNKYIQNSIFVDCLFDNFFLDFTEQALPTWFSWIYKIIYILIKLSDCKIISWSHKKRKTLDLKKVLKVYTT